MTEKLNDSFWKAITFSLAALLIGVGAYFVREKDNDIDHLNKRIDRIEALREDDIKFFRERIAHIEARLIRIEEKLDVLKQRGVK